MFLVKSVGSSKTGDVSPIDVTKSQPIKNGELTQAFDLFSYRTKNKIHQSQVEIVCADSKELSRNNRDTNSRTPELHTPKRFRLDLRKPIFLKQSNHDWSTSRFNGPERD